jgi:SAM-dependent methyltransferase
VQDDPADVYHTARDEEYLRTAREEAAFWDRHGKSLSAPDPHPRLQAYYNERFTGDERSKWHEIIRSYGEFRHGCVLGCGYESIERQILAQNPSLHLTFYDISGEQLARRLRHLQSEFPERVDTRHEDLNFALLPENAYDLIVSNSAMHHVVNLEHAAFQANKALTPDGVLFLQDFVAESRFQFCEMKKRVFEAIAYATGPKRTSPYAYDWPHLDPWEHSPFEAVRSGETLEVFRRYLDEVEIRVAGAILILFMYAGLHPPDPPKGRRMLLHKLASAVARLRLALTRAQMQRRLFDRQQIGDLLIIVDRIMSEAGCLQPGLAFGVYRKRQTPGA